MKKNKYIEFKVSKKLLKGIVATGCILGLSTTAFAYVDNYLTITDEAPVIKIGSGKFSKGARANPLDYVTATDKEDGDLTEQISYKISNYVLSGNDPLSGNGDYTLFEEIEVDSTDKEFWYGMGDLATDSYIYLTVITFSVTDSDGNTTSTTTSYRDRQVESNPLKNIQLPN